MEDWNPVVKALTEVTPSIRYHPNLSCSSALDTWVFGDRVTLIGDAAHAHGGAFATGGSLAMDDAYALYLSLTSIFPTTTTQKPFQEDIRRALKLYEATRKPHAERLLKMVLAANDTKVEKIWKGTFETDEQLRARAARGANMSWLHEHDVVKAFDKTLKRSRKDDENDDESFARL
jgi:salicylate hydroxylase